MVVIKLLKN